MRRHPALLRLTREHHGGLLLAVRLQQGGKTLLAGFWSHDPAWQAGAVVKAYEESLSPHFVAEENILLPALRPRLRATEEALLGERILDDHRRLAAMVEEFRRPSKLPSAERLAAFGALLESHIRFEERTLFPAAEERLTEADLEQIRHRLEAGPEGTTACAS